MAPACGKKINNTPIRHKSIEVTIYPVFAALTGAEERILIKISFQRFLFSDKSMLYFCFFEAEKMI